MQPPSTTPAPNNTTNNPRTAIFFLFPGRPAPQKITLKSQLSEKAAPLPRFIAHPQSPSCVLLQECRSATLAGPDQKTT
jgi:hypothetical protein